ncbi:MAG: hypothetical protein ACYCST_08615 [Acidimicrobiales bacterium]
MKVLVVGSVPPPPGSHRDDLLGEVLRLRDEGHDVDVVSLNRLGAAHRYLSAPGALVGLEVGLLARRAGAVVLQIEPGLPVRHSAGRLERSLALLLLAAALRIVPEVTLRLDSLDDLPGGQGGRAAIELWKAADSIEVADEAIRSTLDEILGPLGSKVVVTPGFVEATRGAVPCDPAALDGWSDGALTTASQVQAAVRARAAAQREVLGAQGRLPVKGGGQGVRVQQWQWLPTPGAGVPDLGAIPFRDGTGGRIGRNLRRRRRYSRLPHQLRRGAAQLLAIMERRPFARPAARLARLAVVELRGSLRGGDTRRRHDRAP